MKKTVYRIFSICLSFFVFFSGSIYARAESQNVEIQAPSAILMEAKTGKVIYEKNPDEIRSPASITKIMTMLLAFEQLEKGKIKLEDEHVRWEITLWKSLESKICHRIYPMSPWGSAPFTLNAKFKVYNQIPSTQYFPHSCFC